MYSQQLTEISKVLKNNTTHYQEFLQLFSAEIFSLRNNQTNAESAQLAYDRLLHIAKSIGDIHALLADPKKLFQLNEWAAIVDGTLFSVMTIHYNVCAGTIRQYEATNPIYSQLLQELETITSVGVYLATELGFGNNVVALKTTAVYQADEEVFYLNTPIPEAQKFMPNTAMPGVSKLAIVMAHLISNGEDHGIFPFVVQLKKGDTLTEGVKVTALPDKPGYSLDNAITSFDQVRLPFSALLNGTHSRLERDGSFSSVFPKKRERFLAAMSRVQPGKLFLSAGSLAMARAAITITCRFSVQKQTFGPGGGVVPVIAYSNHQRALLDCMAKAYLHTFFLQQVLNEYADVPENQQPTADTNRRIAIAKAFATWSTDEILRECRERCGAQGVFPSNRIISYIQYNSITVSGEGDNIVVLIIAGRELLQQNSDNGHISNDFPLQEPGDIRVMQQLFQAKQAILSRRVNDALAAFGGHLPDFDSWNKEVPTVIEIAKAYGHYHTISAAVIALSKVSSAAESAVLANLISLYLLSEIRKDAAFFLTTNLVTSDAIEKILTSIDRLYEELGPYIPALAAAFDIPQTILGAPISSDDFVAAYNYL